MIFESLLIISLLILIWLTMTVTTEYEYPFLTTVILASTVVAIFWFSNISLIDYVKNNYVDVIVGIFAYIVIGIFWSVLKWYGFVSKAAKKYQEYREIFIKECVNQKQSQYIDITTVNNSEVILRDAGKNKLINEFYSRTQFKLPLSISVYKSKIYNWMMFWPFSMSWFLVNKPIELIWRITYRLTLSTYNGITNYYFGKFNSDFK